MKSILRLGLMVLALVVIAVAYVLSSGSFVGPRTSLHIVSGSENEALEPIILDWGQKNRVDVQVSYLGSVDIARELSKGTATEFDAVWPANSLWIELGDEKKVVKHATSILRSPVVLGLRRSIAEDLGWVGRDDVTIQDIQAAARNGTFRLSMTSATQSNSGASAYFGFLYALSGNPDVLGLDQLANEDTQDQVRDLLAQVDRSSGSSGWLKSALVDNPAAYDAMFNYEALVIEANQALVQSGQEPLYAVYPANGLSVADSPLGYISKGDPAKEEAFLALQAHLQTAETQALLNAQGRRAGLIGLMAESADKAVWNPDWGIDLTRAIAPIPIPGSETISEALRLYQSELRKPSLTVWVLDTSGSMGGDPILQLKDAMRLLLDPQSAALNLLQPSSRDITMILPFNHDIGRLTKVEGADTEELRRALNAVILLEADGGTDLYYALFKAFEELGKWDADGTLGDYLPAIVAMTDGASATDNREGFFNYLNGLSYANQVPIHSIAFGDADEDQLQELSNASIGRLFHAKSDLAAALRKAKGYN